LKGIHYSFSITNYSFTPSAGKSQKRTAIMKKNRRTELLVIGAGPGGYPAAFHAADMGMEVTLVDPEPNPGGVCLYRGCVPSKALLHVVSFLHQVELAPQWGISVGKPEVDNGKLRQWKDAVVDKLTSGLGQLVKQRKIEYLRGRAAIKNNHHATVEYVNGDSEEIDFEHAIVATGSVPAMIPGIPDSPRIMTSRQALDVETVPQDLLVVGAGYIGMELGQFYAAVGSNVTMVEMQSEILPGADRDLVRFLSKRIDDKFEKIMLETRVKEMKEQKDGIRVSFEGKNQTEKTFDKVMLSIGRKPRTDGVGLENTRVDINESGFIEIDEQRRTGEPNIFAIGDVAGQPMLAHKATHEARVAVEAIAGKKTIFNPRAIPFVVFSDPEIAWCGLTESDAQRKGEKIKVTKFPWSASGRGATLSRQDGLTKIICAPETGRVLGVGIAGEGAGELLAEAVLAMEMGAVAEDIALTIHTHPTLSETLMESAQSFSGRSIHYGK
jgi:dihydrolipoamide dehydrogenase